MAETNKPWVASYCTYFLKAEMQHVYRQVTGLRRVQNFVVTQYHQNADRYPYQDIEVVGKARTSPVLRAYQKYFEHQPALFYRGEFELIRRILVRRDPELMHIYFGNTAVHLLPLIQSWDRPCVVSFHGMDVQSRPGERGYSQKLKSVFREVTLVLVRSQSIAERVRELGCDPSKIRMNRTAIPLDGFSYVDRMEPQNKAWQLVQACRLIRKKGLGTALKAFARFLTKYPNSIFTIAGEGPLREELTQVVQTMGLSRNVRFAGFLDQPDLRRLYADSHLFVHPSEITADANQEGVPNSMLEAMASGLPVAATKHGGIPEAVEEGVSGVLVPERDDEALAQAMLKILDDPSRWAEMSRQASLAVANKFESGRQIQTLENSYFEAINLWRKSSSL